MVVAVGSGGGGSIGSIGDDYNHDHDDNNSGGGRYIGYICSSTNDDISKRAGEVAME